MSLRVSMPMSKDKLRKLPSQHRYGVGVALAQQMAVTQGRLLFVIIVFSLAFLILAGRLLSVSFWQGGQAYTPHVEKTGDISQRAEIIDRQGVLLAVNLATASLYANPRVILDVKEAATKLHQLFPELSYKSIFSDLSSTKSFIWIKRNLTPKEQYEVNLLGIPGLYFERGERRVYPHGNLLSHVLGYVGLDGKGLAGIEKQFDRELSFHQPSHNEENSPSSSGLELSIDVRVQHVVHEELQVAMQEFHSLGAVSIIADVYSGEIISMVSLPDFDPHNPGDALSDQLFHRASLGVYEMGSSFKTFTLAAALDNKAVSVKDSFDVNSPIKAARFSISDYHPKGGWLSVPEIFMYSSNIGTAKIGLQAGKKAQQQFLKQFGLLDPVAIELPERATPIFPSPARWSDISMLTISFGHGIAVTPLHLVRAMSAMVNGGVLPELTLRKRIPELLAQQRRSWPQVIQSDTSEQMRKLLRLVVEHGTGSKAKSPGYWVGGKTGTAEKNHRGSYSKHMNLASFIAAFPIYDPKYVVLVIVDEPKGNKTTGGYATGGTITAPIAGKIISRVGPMLGMLPLSEQDEKMNRQLWLEFNRSGEAL
jgi:cell division protein FtsI (penicillin-binding protein 3)